MISALFKPTNWNRIGNRYQSVTGLCCKYTCNILSRDGQLGLICQIAWHQNLNMAVSGFYPDRAFWSLLGDTAMLDGFIHLFVFRVAWVCQSINQMLYLKSVTQLAQGYSSLRPSLNIHVKAIHCLNKIHKKNNDKNKTHIITYIVHIISKFSEIILKVLPFRVDLI